MAFTTPKTWSAGETLTAANFNTHIRDNQLSFGPHLIIRKPSDESIASSVALQSDDHLQLTVAANEVWLVSFHLRWTADSAGDIGISFSFPASGTFDAAALVPGGNANLFQDAVWMMTASDTGTLQFGGSGTGVRTQVIQGVYVGAGTAGTLILRWCQGSSNVNATVVKANSTLWAVKLA